MEDDIVIKVEGLYKKFCTSLKRSMAYGSVDLFKNFVGLPLNPGKLRKKEFWALEDINFELRKGETLGILGINGSGKSTLLRVLTGIFPPDKGKVYIDGNIGALIAVGAGFHPHMSGRENIYLNGTILGMTRKEIDEKFDKIINFADIGDFLDAPVSTYSSGMRVRLGFSIAIHCQPDILLVDEILSVGDISFRNKSLKYMSEFRKKAKAVIFISHDTEQVRILCNRVIIMKNGKIIFDGDTHEGIAKYEEETRDIRVKNFQTNVKRVEHDGTIEIKDLHITNEANKKVDSIGLKEPLTVKCKFSLKRSVESLSFYVSITPDSSDVRLISVVSNDFLKKKFENLVEGEYEVEVKFDQHHLAPGVYNPNIGFRNDQTFETYQKFYSNIAFKVEGEGKKLERGLLNVESSWQLKKISK